MSTDFVVKATKRNDIGKGASRRLRRSEMVPAVIYGGGADPESLTLNHHEFIHMLENEAFYSSILTVDVEGKKSQAILRDLQRHAYKPKILHVDLQRVSAKEKIHMHVPLHFLGEDKAPGVKDGGAISHSMSDLEISCLPADLPEFIEVDLSTLEMDGVVHISDIKLPKGVESVALSHGEDHDLPVASIHKTRAAVEEEPSASAGDEAAPSGDEAAPEEGGE
ncbi:MAG: 50S ribosomal protein L25/general stress protein Ctc [Gammaproteobacteria bacterium]|nr:50S ribosomal protein L25/general stress protein Ctc [Gammaproteobacteria bacterium]